MSTLSILKRWWKGNPIQPTHCYVFVCDKGDLEVKASLLAISLKQYLDGNYEIVAAIPSSQLTKLDSVTFDLFNRLSVRQVAIDNKFGPEYPIGNKFSSLSIDTDADQLVFLDSDILCMRTLSGLQEFNAPFCAKPADLNSFHEQPDFWKFVYTSQHMRVPNARVETTVSMESIPPYFNAGVIAVN